ncbi:MAG: alginate export family protein [Thermodesulfovibrio sp.]
MSNGVIFLFLVLILSSSSFAFAVENEIGASIRLRQEILDNFIYLGTTRAAADDRSYFRLRIQLWDNVKFNKEISLYARLATEPRYHVAGPYRVTLDNERNLKRLDQDEIFIDNLYLDFKKPFDLPVNLRIGRQDFLGKDMYGEGFIIFDGTPADGSRSFYVNAVKLQLIIVENHTIDFVYISNPRTDIYLPSLHPSVYDTEKETSRLYINHKKRLTASHEQGFLIYGRNKLSQKLMLEPYYLYKTEDQWATNPQLNFHTFGMRAVLKINEEWSLRGELARQIGKYSDGRGKTGIGGYVFLIKAFPQIKFSPKIEIGFVYLSGDNRNTGKDEAWNPPFSRGAFTNELFAYIVIPETVLKGGPIPGYWTNLREIVTKLSLNLSKNANLCFSYQHLWSDKKTNFTATPLNQMFSNDGYDRGHMLTFLGIYQFTKNVDGLLQFEYFIPEDFYTSKAKNATFIRWQIQYKL